MSQNERALRHVGAGIRRLRLILPAAILVLAAPSPAGPPPDAVRAVQAAAGAGPPDPGAIRFTMIRPRGAGATLYDAGRGPQGIIRTVTDLSQVTDGSWSVDGRETRPLAGETLDYFTARIDAAITAKPDEAVCADQPVYYAEHGAAGIAGGCGTASPAAAIARALGLAEPIQP